MPGENEEIILKELSLRNHIREPVDGRLATGKAAAGMQLRLQ